MPENIDGRPKNINDSPLDTSLESATYYTYPWQVLFFMGYLASERPGTEQEYDAYFSLMRQLFNLGFIRGVSIKEGEMIIGAMVKDGKSKEECQQVIQTSLDGFIKRIEENQVYQELDEEAKTWIREAYTEMLEEHLIDVLLDKQIDAINKYYNNL